MLAGEEMNTKMILMKSIVKENEIYIWHGHIVAVLLPF